MKNTTTWLAVGGAVALLTVAVQAATITIEPDDYAGDLSGVAPGARLVTVRDNGVGTGYVIQKAFSVPGGSWSPTGGRVFGHSVLGPGDLAYHWDNLASAGGAWECYANQNCGQFKVFGVYFRKPASSVKILTTMRGEQAMDPVELWAFDTNGNRILQCKLDGVDNEVLQTGILPPPRYYNPVSRTPCGAVVEVKNCQSQAGDCDYVVEMRVQRKAGDIAFAWFGGRLWGNTHANVDALTYTVP
jgi:hypothetical protein